MAKQASEVVAASQQRNKDKGGGRLTINLMPEDMDDWSAWLDRFPKGRGQQKAAFMAAIRAGLASGKLSKEQLLAELKRRLK